MLFFCYFFDVLIQTKYIFAYILDYDYLQADLQNLSDQGDESAELLLIADKKEEEALEKKQKANVMQRKEQKIQNFQIKRAKKNESKKKNQLADKYFPESESDE